MVAPLVVAAGIGAGSALLGGFLGNRSARRAAAADRAAAREMAQHGVQWRVEDAKRAGVHPVYALNAQLPSYSGSTPSMGDFGVSEAGQNISRAVAATETEQQRAANELQIRLLESQIGENDARAGYYRSLAVRGGGANQPAAPMPSWSGADVIEGQSVPYRPVAEPGVFQLEPGAEYKLPGAMDVVNVKSAEQMSARSGAPWVSAGVNPGSKEYRLTRNMAVLLPAANDLGEALEPLSESPALMYLWYKINVNHYGREFTDLAFQELGLPGWVLRAVRGMEGWSEFMSMPPPSVRALPQEVSPRARAIGEDVRSYLNRGNYR